MDFQDLAERDSVFKKSNNDVPKFVLSSLCYAVFIVPINAILKHDMLTGKHTNGLVSMLSRGLKPCLKRHIL